MTDSSEGGEPSNVADGVAAALFARENARRNYERVQQEDRPLPEQDRALHAYTRALAQYHETLEQAARRRRE